MEATLSRVDADINFNVSDYDQDIKQVVSNFTKDEFVHILRRQSTGFSRGSSKYRGVTLHKCGRWEARMGQFLSKNIVVSAAEFEGTSSFVKDTLYNLKEKLEVEAHPRQLHNWVGGPPNLYDISGSSHFINKCDNRIVIHRNRDPEAGPMDQVQVCVRKSFIILEYMIGDYDETYRNLFTLSVNIMDRVGSLAKDFILINPSDCATPVKHSKLEK
ncbi:unnamed protein product [Sphenostylis stenocarpa]|uniref:Uncharacterized protein n=1 Tax=Sphenostylis stenocarpa TaxID=92480 RepID=A0AA86VCP7_9FABA|nr:unnamed protein product [Sphenostylis stenocarpa]